MEETATKRTVEEIDKEYSGLCTQLGHEIFKNKLKQAATEATVQGLLSQMDKLNEERNGATNVKS